MNTIRARITRDHLKALRKSGRKDPALQALAESVALAFRIDSTKAAARYRAAAERYHQKYGEVEFDDDAAVSPGNDPGAYVMAWVWVSNDDVKRLKEQP